MADEENNEPKKRGGLVKILLFAFGGIALIGIGLGVGFVLFGSTQPDPSEEIEKNFHCTAQSIKYLMKVDG